MNRRQYRQRMWGKNIEYRHWNNVGGSPAYNSVTEMSICLVVICFYIQYARKKQGDREGWGWKGEGNEIKIDEVTRH